MQRCRWSILLMTLILLLASSACQSWRDLAHDLDPRQRPEVVAYEKAIDPFLKVDRVYHGPATELLVKALPLVMPVRRAMANRKAAAYDMEIGQLDQELSLAREENQRGLELVLSVFMPETKWNNLASQYPSWKVYLQYQEKKKLHATDVRRIKKRTSMSQALYPFWGPWDRLYRLRFDIKPIQGRYQPAEGVVLIIAGPPGRVRIPLILD